MGTLYVPIPRCDGCGCKLRFDLDAGSTRLTDEVLAAIVIAHADAIAAGEPGYTDPSTGLFVFTADYLTARGTCCDSGCRHCPYGLR